MRNTIYTAAALAAIPLARAATTGNCVDLMIPVSATAEVVVFNTVNVTSNIEAVEFTRSRDMWDALSIADISVGNTTVGGNYTISGQLCVPSNTTKNEDIVIITSHGVGLNKYLFDCPYQPENYSFTDAALNAGYSVLTYDRLGAGLSSIVDAYTALQVPLQSEVVRALTEHLLDGDIVSSSKVTGGSLSSYKADKVVHLGHSMGSIVTNYFLTQHANLSSAAILTGFLISDQFANLKIEVADLAYAPEANAAKWGNRTAGYLVIGTQNAFQLDSFRAETLDPEMLNVWEESIESTMGVGEILTFGDAFGVENTAYSGPLMMFAGECDFGFCQGDCRNTFNTTQIEGLYPKASVEIYLQPDTGHVVQLSKNATGGYQVQLDFLASHGL